MISNLTKEQMMILDDMKKEFMSPLSYTKVNKERAKESVRTIFGLCGLSEPDIYIVDSPMAGLENVKTLNVIKIDIRKKLYNKIVIEGYVTEQELKVRKKITELVDNELKEFFRDNVSQYRVSINLDFLEHVHNRVRSHSFRSIPQIGLSYYIGCEMIKYIPWLAYYYQFKKLGILENELFDAYIRYAQSGIFANTYFDKANMVILIKNPLYVINDRNRLSNKDGYAIEWPDGYGIHFVNGVHFDRELYDSLFINKTIKGKEILLLQNTEQKAIAIQQYGYYNMLEDIGAKKIGEEEIMTKFGPDTNELYDFEVTEGLRGWRIIRGRFVKVVDYSTRKITCLGVPIEEGTKTVRGAIAWTFGKVEADYHPVIET